MQKFKDTVQLAEGINDPGIFKAVFLAGGPGSGKSFIVGQTALTSFGLKLVNSDDTFEHLLKKAGLEATPKDIFSDKGQAIRGKAKAITGNKQVGYMNGRLGLVIDGTGKDFGKIQKQATALKKLGYEVAMIFVNTDLDTAQSRNKKRERTLPEKQVESMWKDVQKNIGKFQNMFDNNFHVVDNSNAGNIQGATLSVYRKIGQFTRTPPSKPAAKRWIQSQKKQRGLKEGEEHSWKSVGHYTKDGKEWTGLQHAHKGQVMTGEKHTDSSEKLFHFKELPTSIQRRLIAKMKLKEDLRKWFGKGKKGDWVRVGTDGEIKGDCAREPGEGKPKCMPRSKAHSMDKDDRATSARRKRRKDPVADRKGKGGKPIMVKTDVEEACWKGWTQKGMKKKGDRIVPNCVKEDGTIMYEKVKDMSMGDVIKDFRQSDAPQFKGKSKQKRTQMAIAAKLQSQEEGYTLPKLKPAKSLEQRRLSKKREKKKGFAAKIDPVTKEIGTKSDISEAPRWMLDPLARTVYKMQYKQAAKMLKKMMDAEKKKKGNVLRHSPEYYALQVTKDMPTTKVDARTLAKMVAEEYKYEWGTPEATAYYKKMTPGEKKKTEDIKPIKTPISVKEEQDFMSYMDEIETTGFKQEDIDDLYDEIDSMQYDDLVDLGVYDEEEEYTEVDVHDDINVTEELSIQGRMKRRFNARRNKQKLSVARRRRGGMASDPARIKRKASRGARNMMKRRLARGRDTSTMPPAEKARLEKMLVRFAPIVTKLAQRMIPAVRKAEIGRLKSKGNKKSQKAKKFKITKGGTASKYKAKKFKVKKR
jgi:dephospho-CoA kinase